MFGRLLNSLPLKTLRGYQHPELIEMVFQKTLTYRPMEAWPEMVGVSRVLDFGGGCGRHYRDALQSSPDIRWAVVETDPMVVRAKELETNNLKFFSDIDSAAAWLGDIDVVHCDGSLQYVDDPIETASSLCATKPKQLMWFRIPFGDGSKHHQISPLGDNGPGKQKTVLKRISYELTTIRKDDFLKVHAGYRIEAQGDDWFRFAR